MTTIDPDHPIIRIAYPGDPNLSVDARRAPPRGVFGRSLARGPVRFLICTLFVGLNAPCIATEADLPAVIPQTSGPSAGTDMVHNQGQAPSVYTGQRAPKSEKIGYLAPESTICPITAEGIDSGTKTQAPPFHQWLATYQRDALLCGVSTGTLSVAFRGLTPRPEVLRLDRRQAEFTRTFHDYLNSRVTEGVVKIGRGRIRQHEPLLTDLEDRYGVPKEVLVTLWGLESGFGADIGKTPVLAALSTLAYDGRRPGLFRRELLGALRILESGHVTPGRMVGSWAGAMGQTQFMPTTFLDHGLDGDGDGRIDVWGSIPDALESAANYLAAIGWEEGQAWGMAVSLPAGFDAYQARLSLELSSDAWDSLGVRRRDGRPLPSSNAVGSILLPAGIQGPAFLVQGNYRVILEWNRSLLYALSVGILSDRLGGKRAATVKPPPGDRPIPTREVLAMQEDLNGLGFDAGPPDGMIGVRTRQALRDYQRSRGMVADAYPSSQLMDQLEREAQGGEPPSVEPPLDSRNIKILQEHLARLGYPAGGADGVMGPKTRRALRAYLRDRGLAPTSTPSPRIMLRITRDPGG